MPAPVFQPPRLAFRPRLPAPSTFGEEAFLVYDRKLASVVPGFRRWAESFPASYGVRAGETLKDVAEFARHADGILSRTRAFSREGATFVAAGGGSVGDFAGFFASIWKRGARFVQIPTTWLAAIDSAHGGKNALNAGGVKNALGTFHFPDGVEIIRALLDAQPPARAREAAAELAKIGLLEARPWFLALTRKKGSITPREIWRALPEAIDAKYRFVAADPHEKLGPRRLLNLGHTLGHVLERAHALPHGIAVGEGLRFALAWSAERGAMSASEAYHWLDVLERRFKLAPLRRRPLPRARFLRLAAGDKKSTSSGGLRFVFLRSPGDAFAEKVSFEALAREAKRQGWVA